MQRAFLVAGILSLTCTLSPAAPAGEITGRGFVFEDANHNGVRDPGESGVPDVRVSNGRQIVLTDSQGAYEIPVDDDTIIFVIKPRDWMSGLDKLNLPRFYYIHKPSGTPKLKYPGVAPTGPLPESVDFPLYRRPEPDHFRVLLFGDTQPYSLQEISFLAHDIIEQVIGTDAAFAISLGDLVGDHLELHEPLNHVQAHTGIPMYNVLGNHDMDYEAMDDQYSDDDYERVYGPSYYSFDYGPVHFIVLDSIIWHGATEKKKRHYKGGLGEKQLEFLRSDLKLVPKDTLVVLSMHIPMVEFLDKQELYGLLAQHPHAVSFSAHWHTLRHFFLDADDGWPGEQPHHHMVTVTTCGSWWHGAPDEVGIPNTPMADGTPNGWCIVTFDGHRYSVEYYPARRPADYQMNIYTPDAVKSADAGNTEVVVNVFAGSERSTVEMRFAGGPWSTLERVERVDPYYAAIKKAEESDHPPRGRKLPKAENSPHIWVGRLPADPPVGTHLIEVQTTDVFGHTYHGRRIIRVE